MKEIIYSKLFSGNTTVLGSKMQYPNTRFSELTLWKIILPQKTVGEWHEHLVPEFFYVESGILYVANKRESGEIDVVSFKEGEIGLTDINVPQFIWNPTNDEAIITAIYFGENGMPATRKLSGKPDDKLLEELLKRPLTPNQTM